jgi:hypothetical protein
VSGVLRWEKPPTGKDMRAADQLARWTPVADELRARPGEWAVVAEGDTQDFNRIIGYIRGGRGPFAPEKSFEARQRTEPTKGARGGRTGRIYARYIGPTVGAR